jgi:hypothetical protein
MNLTQNFFLILNFMDFSNKLLWIYTMNFLIFMDFPNKFLINIILLFKLFCYNIINFLI